MDGSIFRWINRLATRTGWAHWLFTTYANDGVVLFAILLVAAYVLGRQDGELGVVAASVWAAGSALVALGIGQLIGSAVNRARPYTTMPGVHVLIDKSADFSFPSDHATVVGAVAAGLLVANRRIGLLATVLAVVMAFTRVYVGAHYPGDVLAGLALGATVAAAGRPLIVPILTRIAAWLAGTPARALVSAPRTSVADEQ